MIATKEVSEIVKILAGYEIFVKTLDHQYDPVAF
jgi:hypothetical protein